MHGQRIDMIFTHGIILHSYTFRPDTYPAFTRPLIRIYARPEISAPSRRLRATWNAALDEKRGTMSYPSIAEIAERKRINLETASEEECGAALLEAFERDLPLGMNYLQEIAHKVKRTNDCVLQSEDPLSPTGQEVIRLLGTDIARDLVEERFDVLFGLYNCCGVKGAPKSKGRKGLNMSRREQIQMQNGEKARANC